MLMETRQNVALTRGILRSKLSTLSVLKPPLGEDNYMLCMVRNWRLFPRLSPPASTRRRYVCTGIRRSWLQKGSQGSSRSRHGTKGYEMGLGGGAGGGRYRGTGERVWEGRMAGVNKQAAAIMYSVWVDEDYPTLRSLDREGVYLVDSTNSKSESCRHVFFGGFFRNFFFLLVVLRNASE